MQQTQNVSVTTIGLLVDVLEVTTVTHSIDANVQNVSLITTAQIPNSVYSSAALIHARALLSPYVLKTQFVVHRIIEPFVFAHHIYPKVTHYLTVKQLAVLKANQNVN